MIIVATICFGALLPTMVFGYTGYSSCPAIYKRFARGHSFCRGPNIGCQTVEKGLDPRYIPEIVDLHNKFRSKVASGLETRAGGLPPAADMLQLTWDEELANVAQSWTEQCHFKQECSECRAVRAFSVGQNLAFHTYQCSDDRCYKAPDWTTHITGFYDEVQFFNKKLVEKLKSKKLYAHFVGICYAETYKIGCGYISYIEGGVGKQIYACNYGPGATMKGELLYQEGPPCSKCPKNSCCGTSCGDGAAYPSVCRLESTPPYYIPKETSLYLCQFQYYDPMCQFAIEGPDKWDLINTVGGTYLNIIGRPGGVNTAHFSQQTKVSVTAEKSSCLILTHRRGPQVAGDPANSNTEILLEDNGRQLSPITVSAPANSKFRDVNVPLVEGGEIRFSIKFSAPASAQPQFLEIKQIEITDAACQSGASGKLKSFFNKLFYLILFLCINNYVS